MASHNIPGRAGAPSSPVPIQRTSSNPIAIAGSSSLTANGHHRHHPSSYDSLSSEDSGGNNGGHREIGLGSFSGRTDPPPGGLTVGSLPSHHRRHRHHIGGAGVGGALGAGSSGGGGGIGSSMARSLPPPRAPFLSARENPSDRLSNMPLMTLPESADDGMGESSTVQYGSLRESRFQRYHSTKRSNRQHHHNVRFAGLPTGGIGGTAGPGGDGGENGSGLSSSYAADSSSAFFPQSLPSHMDAERNMIQKRREKRSSLDTIDSVGSATNSDGIGGIGASLAKSNDAPLTGVGALSARLGGMGVSKDVSDDNNRGEGGLGGIGSMVEASSNGLMAKHQQSGIGATMGYEENVSRPVDSVGLRDYGLGGDEENFGDEEVSHLSTSLTALDILKTSRQSPGGLGVMLNEAEKEDARKSANRAARALNEAEVNTGVTSGQDRYSFERQSSGQSGGLIDPNEDDDRPDACGAFEFDLEM